MGAPPLHLCLFSGLVVQVTEAAVTFDVMSVSFPEDNLSQPFCLLSMYDFCPFFCIATRTLEGNGCIISFHSSTVLPET